MQVRRLKTLGRIISKFSLLAFVFLTQLISCTKQDMQPTLNACDSQNPLEEIIWLREMKNSLNECDLETSIIKGNYGGQTVFYIYVTDPMFNGIQIPTLYDCAGEVARNFDELSLSDFYESVNEDTILYKCEPILK